MAKQTLEKAGVGQIMDEDNFSMQHRNRIDSRDSSEERERRRQQEKLEKRMTELKRKDAIFEDLKKIVLRRTKIEQWIDEPFFTETMLNSFVRVGFSQKYIIA